MLKAGIVGLPNVGKSTLFNAITKKNILAANYPFATIDPNVGVVTALTHNHGDAMLLIFGAAIVLIVFFIIDIISLISGKKQRGYLLPGYVGVSIGVKCIAILFLVLAYVFKLRI